MTSITYTYAPKSQVNEFIRCLSEYANNESIIWTQHESRKAARSSDIDLEKTRYITWKNYLIA